MGFLKRLRHSFSPINIQPVFGGVKINKNKIKLMFCHVVPLNSRNRNTVNRKKIVWCFLFSTLNLLFQMLSNSNETFNVIVQMHVVMHLVLAEKTILNIFSTNSWTAESNANDAIKKKEKKAYRYNSKIEEYTFLQFKILDDL